MSKKKEIGKGNVKVTIRARVIIKGMKARNTCPSCNSDFVMRICDEFISYNYFRSTLECQDCGSTFSHIYKLIYSHSVM